MFLVAVGTMLVTSPPALRTASPVTLSVEVPYLQVTPKAIIANWNLCIKRRIFSMFGSLPVNPS